MGKFWNKKKSSYRLVYHDLVNNLEILLAHHVTYYEKILHLFLNCNGVDFFSNKVQNICIPFLLINPGGGHEPSQLLAVLSSFSLCSSLSSLWGVVTKCTAAHSMATANLKKS